MSDIVKLLRTLSDAAGPSGYEQAICAVLKEIWQPLVDERHTDRLGNLVAIRRGMGPEPRRRLLLAAHMDEIALLVNNVVDHQGFGFLRVTPIGSIDRRHLIGQLVRVHGQRELSGVIGCLPVSMLPDERRRVPFSFEDLVIDPGLPAEVVKAQVSVGDYVTFRQPLRKLLGKKVTGKALDNRVSLAALTSCMHHLRQRTHQWDIHFVATTQEETSLLGAFTSGFAHRPDVAIAIDVEFGKGPGVSEPGTFDLGSGPVLGLGPNVHTGVYEQLKATARELEMTVNTSAHGRGSGTDAYGLQVAREGVPTGILMIPLRNMHTMVEIVDTADVERCGRLLSEFAVRLDDTFVETALYPE